MAPRFSRLLRSVARLKARSGKTSRLPALIFVTDPARISDPVAILKALPHAANGRLAVIFRHFGASNRLETALTLAAICRRRRFVFLIGADAALASRVRAHGVHMPQRLCHQARAVKKSRPKWIVTLAAHDRGAMTFGSGLDGLLVSPVFGTQSAGAQGRKQLGRRGLHRFARNAPAPIYALGGLNSQNIRKIEGIAGIAGAAMASSLAKL